MSITVIIPCYNAEPYLAQAIESVLAQSRPVDEILLVDDCSTDGSRRVAERYPVKIMTTPRNSGPAAARNVAIDAARGELIAWLDADDYWLANHVETVAGLLARSPEADVAFSGVQFFGTRTICWNQFPSNQGPCRLFREAFVGTPVPAMSALTRTAAMRRIGGFDASIRIAPDFDMWLRLARDCVFFSTEQITAYYRWHAAQISARPDAQSESVWASRTRFLRALHAAGNTALLAELQDLAPGLWETRLQTLSKTGDWRALWTHLKVAPLYSANAARKHRLLGRLHKRVLGMWQAVSSRAA